MHTVTVLEEKYWITTNKYLCQVAVFCVALWPYLVEGNVFTSVQDMEQLYFQEGQLLDSLEAAIQFHQTQLDMLVKRQSEILSKRATTDMLSDYIGHPVNCFTLIRRLSRDWPLILNIMAETYDIPADVMTQALKPGFMNMQSAVRGLTRLQQVYDLNIDELADGKVENVQALSKMTAADCVEMANYLLEQHEMVLTGKWLVTALRKVMQDEDQSIPQEKIISSLYLINKLARCEQEDYVPLPEPLLQQLLTLYPSFTLDAESADLYRLTLSDDCSWYNEISKLDEVDMSIEEHNIYNDMCKGEPKGPTDLHCYYTHYNRPAQRLAPFKLEELFISPPVLLVHDAITDNEITEMKGSFLNVMVDCEVVREGKSVPSSYRTCKRGWMPDNITPASGRVAHRIGQLANLSMLQSEMNQMACYGLGGEYKLHYDPLQGDDLRAEFPMGQRLATVMLYLSDVIRGGYTVFPNLNLAVKPVKGAAVIWFNVLHNGIQDNRMLHGGCPVLLGNKWVLNKWIREGGQYFQDFCPSDMKFPKDYYYL